jgi:hypothetical protein
MSAPTAVALAEFGPEAPGPVVSVTVTVAVPVRAPSLRVR